MPRMSRPPPNVTFAVLCLIAALLGFLAAREGQRMYRERQIATARAGLACLAAIADAEHWVRTWKAAELGPAKVRTDVLRGKLEDGCIGERVEVEYRRITEETR